MTTLTFVNSAISPHGCTNIVETKRKLCASRCSACLLRIERHSQGWRNLIRPCHSNTSQRSRTFHLTMNGVLSTTTSRMLRISKDNCVIHIQSIKIFPANDSVVPWACGRALLKPWMPLKPKGAASALRMYVMKTTIVRLEVSNAKQRE